MLIFGLTPKNENKPAIFVEKNNTPFLNLQTCFGIPFGKLSGLTCSFLVEDSFLEETVTFFLGFLPPPLLFFFFAFSQTFGFLAFGEISPFGIFSC